MAQPATKKRLGDFLLEEGLIDKFQLQAALAEQKKWGGRLGKHLIELGILSEEVLVKVLSKLLALPSVDVGRLSIPRVVIDYVQVRTAEKFNVIPIGIEDAPGSKKTIIVAMSDPTNLAALDELRFTTGCAVRPVVSGDTSIERAIRSYYYNSGDMQLPPSAGVRRPAGSGANEPAPEMVIMSKGDVLTMRMDGGSPVRAGAGTVPRNAPEAVSSLPPNALTPAQAPPSEAALEEYSRRLNALLRVLVKRKIMTEEEFLAELEKD